MYSEIFLNCRISNEKPTFTYKIPDNLINKIKPGQKVLVPFRNQKVIGLVYQLHDHEIKFQTKEIISLEEKNPILQPWQIKLLNWISETYFASLFTTLQLFLPEKFWSNKNHIQREKIFSLANPEINLETFKNAKKQKSFLQFLLEHKIISNLNPEIKNFSSLIIKNLLQKKIIKMEEGKIINYTCGHANMRTCEHNNNSTLDIRHSPPCPLQPTTYLSAVASTKADTLLQYSDSSEKISYYLNLINHHLSLNQQTLLLIPEISYLEKYLQILFPLFLNQITIFHGDLNAQTKINEWARIQTQEASIIIGTSLSLFAPFRNLGAIIVDDEHNFSYKRQSSPRFHARDIALKIGEFTNPKIILSSYAPSLESYYQVLNKKYSFQKTKKQISQNFPIVVDLRNELKRENYSPLSERLQLEIKKTIDQNKKVILFLNRRGFASSVTCRDCGRAINCPNCHLPLAYHSRINTLLRCHHCLYQTSMPSVCPNCRSIRIKFLGTGTEKLISEIKKLFPLAKTARLDQDTARLKNDFNNIKSDFEKGLIDILIGTQKILPFTDLPQVNLIGIILADIGLNIPNFRGNERFFQLLSSFLQQKEKKIIIQTYNPDNPTLALAIRAEYEKFAAQELNIRKSLNYPPFYKIIKLINQNISQERCAVETKKTEERLKLYEKKLIEYAEKENKTKLSKTEINSTPSLNPFSRGKYSFEIILKGKNPEKILNMFPLGEGWKVDIDG